MSKRELLEETGLIAKELIHLKSCWVSAGKSDTRAHFYIAICETDIVEGFISEPGIKVSLIAHDDVKNLPIDFFSDSNSTALFFMGCKWINSHSQSKAL